MIAVRKRVLVSESNDALRSILATALFRQNLDVDTANDVETTLERLSSCDYAVLLISLDGTAEEILSRHRSVRPESTTVVFGMSSGNGHLKNPELLHAIIEKPFEISSLAEMIRDAASVVELPDDALSCPPPENPSTRNFDDTGEFWTN